MIATNSNWDAKHAESAKQPIYVMQIGGQATAYATADLAGIAGAPAAEPWLRTPRGATQTITLPQGSSSIGELECEVIDQGGAVRTLAGENTLEGASLTLRVGYAGLAWSEFIVLHVYQIYKITPGRGYTSWVFRARDLQMMAKRMVRMNPENGTALSDENPWIVQGTPGEIMQAVYLFALGRPAADLDRAAMVALDSPAEGLFHATRPFRFRLTEAFEAKQFLESELFKTAGLYPVVANTGAISLRASRPPAGGASPAYAFTPDNVIVLPEIDRAPVVNEVAWKWDHDGSGYAHTVVFADASSISAYGRSGALSIESRGLRTECGAWWWAQNVSMRLFRRFGGVVGGLRGGAMIVRIQAMLATLPVWVGDFVSLSHPAMPDLTSGDLGVDGRVFEVIDRNPDYAAGRMRYTLLDTGLTGLAPAVGVGTWTVGSEVF